MLRAFAAARRIPAATQRTRARSRDKVSDGFTCVSSVSSTRGSGGEEAHRRHSRRGHGDRAGARWDRCVCLSFLEVLVQSVILHTTTTTKNRSAHIILLHASPYRTRSAAHTARPRELLRGDERHQRGAVRDGVQEVRGAPRRGECVSSTTQLMSQYILMHYIPCVMREE